MGGGGVDAIGTRHYFADAMNHEEEQRAGRALLFGSPGRELRAGAGVRAAEAPSRVSGVRVLVATREAHARSEGGACWMFCSSSSKGT
jgi:hypothetical protein